MPVTAEWVKVLRNVNIASLATKIAGLFVWTDVLSRILLKKSQNVRFDFKILPHDWFWDFLVYQLQYTEFHKI